MGKTLVTLHAPLVASAVTLIEECLTAARNAADKWFYTSVRLYMTYCIYLSTTVN